MIEIRYIVFISIVYTISILVPFSFSQNLQSITCEDVEQANFRNSNNHLNENLISNSNVILNIDGSPFNNNDNAQIDSVILKLMVSVDTYEFRNYYYDYDSLGNVEVAFRKNGWKETYTIDSLSNTTSRVYQIWKDYRWVNYFYINYQYDSSGNRINYVSQKWYGNQWVNDRQVNYKFNSNGDITSFIVEDWDGSNWGNTSRRTNYYNSYYALIERLTEYWNGSDWIGGASRTLFEYDNRGNNIATTSQVLIEDNWLNSLRWISEYDGNDYKISTIYEEWQNDNWFIRARWNYSYDEYGNILTNLEEIFESDEWKNSDRATYTYNVSGYLINAKAEEWNDSLWLPTKNASLDLYDSDGNHRDYFGVELNVYYDETTNVEFQNEAIKEFYLYQNYPNPFNPSTTISYSIPNQSHVELSVYDVLGREVAELVSKEQIAGSYKVQFNASSLSSGIYIYKLQNGGYVDVKKLMLLK